MYVNPTSITLYIYQRQFKGQKSNITTSNVKVDTEIAIAKKQHDSRTQREMGTSVS